MRNWTKRILFAIAFGAFACLSPIPAMAQIVPRDPSTPSDRYTSLSDQLVNRLRATRQEQQDYIALVVGKVKNGELDPKLVVAVERYAMKRNSSYPFPFFERAMRYEAAKRGVALPTVHEVASSSTPRPPRR